MKVLKSHRDVYFKNWKPSDWMKSQNPEAIASFDYVSIKKMQRADITPESQSWLKKNAKQNSALLESLRKSIPRDGMISPLILIGVNHSYYKSFVGPEGPEGREWPTTLFWVSIPYIVHVGNNRYKVALENNYTHISSIILGEKIAPKVWEYLQPELKKPLNEKLFVDKDTMRTFLGDLI